MVRLYNEMQPHNSLLQQVYVVFVVVYGIGVIGIRSGSFSLTQVQTISAINITNSVTHTHTHTRRDGELPI